MSTCHNCGAPERVYNVGLVIIYECGSRIDFYYDGHRTDREYDTVCTKPEEALVTITEENYEID